MALFEEDRKGGPDIGDEERERKLVECQWYDNVEHLIGVRQN